MISPEKLRVLIKYDPTTGKLYWRRRSVEMFRDGKYSAERVCRTFNSTYAGKEAFTASSRFGHKIGIVDGHPLQCGRVAWAIHYGKWPERFIDHINGDPSDNRIVNLREASRAQNNLNTKVRSDNTSGYKGVSRVSPSGKWVANIRVNGRKRSLGTFATRESAYAAYCEAAKCFHGDFARLL